MARPPRLAWLGAAAVLALAVARQPSSPRPNILLVTIDTLRADRVGAYGYAAARTPTLDRLAGSAVRFADATAHAPLTYPSHVAILTGRYPAAFGVRLNGMSPLPASATTVAERLKGAGYATGAVIASVILDRGYGLAQGFDEYDDRIPAPVRDTRSNAELQRPADRITTAALAWLKAQRGPWFLWVHYYDPHLPYEAPAKFAAALPARPYDAEVSYVDAELGRLLAGIDPSRTAVVIGADHGESLGDHGEEDHGFFLYDATLHVPLIVAAPGLKPRVVAEQVRNIDIAPTIAALAGLDPAVAAGDEPAGESLLPLLRGETRRDVPVSIAESWYPRLHFGWGELRSARVGEWKYVAAPKPELYDLRVDRAESKNLVRDRAGVASRLSADVNRVMGRFASGDAPKAAQPDAATVERLQALGYVGAFAPATEGGGANPADRIEEYRTYRSTFNRALGALGRGRAAEAATLLRALLKTNVRAFEAHLYLGNAYAADNRLDAALGEYEAAALLNPSLAAPHFEAAKVLSTKGDAAAAVARCRQGLKLEPESFYGYYTLGVIHQRAADWPQAVATLTRAVELNPGDPRARANLAGASMRIENLSVARAQFEAMVALEYQVAPAHYNLGQIAARQGNPAEAERRYKLALAADPAFKPARDALTKMKGK